jgi:hypothetical protein
MRRGAALLPLLGLLTAAASCRRPGSPAPPPRPALGAVVVRDLTPSEEGASALDAAALQRELRDKLIASGLFAGAAADAGRDGPASPVTRVRADVAVESTEVGAKGLARARVRVRLETRPSDAPGGIDEQLEGQGEQPYAARHGAPGAAPFRGLVSRVMVDLVSGFVARRRLRDGPPETVHAALTADGGELREEAIHVAGQRQLRQEVPALLKLLNDPDESTRDAALGALIAMRDRRAVSELTRTRSLRDRREMRKIIEAIAILGGQEAEEYLSFVAETHDDDEIRSEAAAARARLERRADAAAN